MVVFRCLFTAGNPELCNAVPAAAILSIALTPVEAAGMHMGSSRCLLWLCIALLTALTPVVAGADQPRSLRFSTIAGSVNTDVSEQVVVEGYRQLGIAVEVVRLPAERALREADAGIWDGELYRIAGMERRYRQLLPVRVPVNYLEAMVFSREPGLNFRSWQELKALKPAVRRGVKFSEQNTRDIEVYTADSNEQLLQMLLAGRTRVVVMARLNGLETIRRLRLKGIYSAGIIERFPLYHYLHRRHADLQPALTAWLQSEDGRQLVRNLRGQAVERLSRPVSDRSPLLHSAPARDADPQ